MLFDGNGAPEFVDDGRRIPRDIVDIPLEMSGPKAKACLACQTGVVGHHVDFGVVEE